MPPAAAHGGREAISVTPARRVTRVAPVSVVRDRRHG